VPGGAVPINPVGGAASALAGVAVRMFPVPAGSRPHDVAPAADGGVWFTAQADYAAKMREAADDRGACWLDLIPLFPSGSGPDAWTRTFLFDDIHPGDVGHRAFCAAIYTAMLQHCG
jgi:hypothetical protein